jgi:plastocyanin
MRNSKNLNNIGCYILPVLYYKLTLFLLLPLFVLFSTLFLINQEVANAQGITNFTLTIPQGASVQGNPSYDPDTITVKAGDTIAVENEDSTPHTVTNGEDATDPNMGKLFDTSIINAGDSSKIVTTDLKPGEYPFFCSVHPYQMGTLVVDRAGVSSITNDSTTIKDNPVIEAVKTLLNDAIIDLDRGDSDMALMHLDLANQANQQINSTSKNATISTEVISTLLNDAIQDLENEDTNTARAHIDLVNQQLNNTSTMFSNLSNNTMSPILSNDTEQQITDEISPGIAKDNILTYENSTYGIKLQYPSSWQHNASLRPIFDVLFLPQGEVMPSPEVGLGIKKVDIPFGVLMLDQDVDSIYSTIDNTAPIFLKSIIPDFLLTGSGTTNLSGMPAHSMRFIGYIGEGVKAVQTTLLIHDGNLYVLTYFAPLQDFATYLADANRMTDSFKIDDVIGSVFPQGTNATNAAGSLAGEGTTVVMPLGTASNPGYASVGYEPLQVTVSPGASVIWDNQDNALHTATSGNTETATPDGRFDTGLVGANQLSIPVTMPTEPGVYTYFCTLHPSLTGTVRVQ